MSRQYCPIHDHHFDEDFDPCCPKCDDDGHEPDCARKLPPRVDPTGCDCGVVLECAS